MQSIKGLLLLVALFGFSGLATTIGHVSALSGSDFHAGHIIDDVIFTNNTAMSVSDIQNFLNAKMPSCDTNGTTAKTYYVNNSTGEIHTFSFNGASQVNGTRASYGQAYANFWNNHTSDSLGNNRSSTYMTNESVAPYVCLKGYVENPTTHANNLQNPGAAIDGGQSAAQIIWNAAQTYTINPQVLITTLQKEQGLVTDDWPWMNEYEIAMGYACPDGAPCNSQYFGFANQISNAAWQFRRYLTNPNNYNFVVGNDTIPYNPSPSCGSSVVNIQNQATAALYDYTPYQPNAGALSGVSDTSPGGTATCGAYGNRNFWWYFNTWFGSSLASDYQWSVVSQQYSSNTTDIVAGQTTTLTLVAKNIGNATWYQYGANPVRLGTWNPSERQSPFYDHSWFGTTRPAIMQEASVAPGQIGTFTFKINVPKTAGEYREYFNLVSEGVSWMQNPNMNFYLNVQPRIYSWKIISQQYASGTDTVKAGTTTQVTLIAQNTGNVSWTNNQQYPLLLGTSSPQDRTSQFYDVSWIGNNRPALLQEASVAPGSNGTFTFTIKAPTTPGQYREYLNLVAEGFTWLPDQHMNFYFNVVP